MNVNKNEASMPSWIRRFGAIVLASLTAVMTILSGGVTTAFAADTSESENLKTVTLADTESATLSFVGAKGRSLSVKSGTDVKISISAKNEADAKGVAVMDADRNTKVQEAVGGVATVKVEKDITVMPAGDLAVNAEALDNVKISPNKVKDLKDYIKENANPKYVGKASGDMGMADALNVTTTIVDGTKLPNATFAKLNEDANGDNIADNDAALANQTVGYAALYEVGDGDYYVGRANIDFKGAKVTDFGVAHNNAEANMVNDVIYDKATGLVYVPKSYSKNTRLALRMQLVVTTNAEVTDAKAMTRITANNDGVKGALVDDGSAMSNLQMVQTDIKLSNVDDDEAVISADKIDSVDVNGINYAVNDGVWAYDEKDGVLTIGVAPYALTDIKINMSDTFRKSAKKLFSGIVNAIIPGASAAESWVAGTMEFPSMPQVGNNYVVNSQNMYKQNGVSGLLPPMVPTVGGKVPGGIERNIAKHTMGWQGADLSHLVQTKMSIERAVKIPAQTNSGVKIPAMSANLMCSHIEVDLPGDSGNGQGQKLVWVNGKANVRIAAINGNTLIIGVTVPTVNTQAGAGFFKVKWKLAGGYLSVKKISADTNITAGNKCYNMKGAKFGVYKDAAATKLAGTLTVADNGGKSNEGLFPEGNYWVKEISGAAGYGVSTGVRKVHIKAGTHQSITLDGDMKEPVLHDPINILVQKSVEGEENAGVAPGDVAELGGIKFRIDYYDGYYKSESEAKAAGAAKASAVFATDDDGVLLFADAKALDDTTWPYKNSLGNNTSPLGTLVITEVGSHAGLLTKGLGQVVQITQNGNSTKCIPQQYWPKQSVSKDAIGAYENQIMKGGITITKADVETHRSEPQGDATLEGVKYQIVNKSLAHVRVNGQKFEKDEVVWTGVTKYDDSTKTYKVATGQILPYGTYEVTEIETSEGYLNAKWSQTFTIRSDGEHHEYKSQETKWNENKVVRGGVAISKVDRETRQYISLGEAHLDGAMFDIVNKSKYNVVVDGKEHKPGEVVKTIASQLVDGRYIAQTGERDLPYGTYEIHEVGAGKGYLYDSVSKNESYTFTIREDGKIVDMTQPKDATSAADGQAVFDNQVQREDWSFKKKDESSMERMDKVAFLVTSKTTGESHIIVTDENGTWGSAWNEHTNNTNANDPDSPITNGAVIKNGDGNYVVKDASKLDSEAGTWFTGMPAEMTKWAKDGKSYNVNGKIVPVNDAFRSFPYDTYTVKELPSSTNTGHKMVTFTVTLHKYGKADGPGIEIDYGTIDDKTMNIGTSLTYGKDGKVIPAAKDTKLSDVVSYDNLSAGAYTLKGELHLVSADGKDEGVVAKSEKKFEVKGDNGSGSQTVEFTVDATKMGGKKLVAFEYLLQGGSEVAKHEDIDDEDQTVTVPKIGTTLTGDVDHEADASKKTITLTDTVKYENLEVGKTYTVTGTLIDKAAIKALTDKDGKEITASTQFVAKESKGSVTVVFKFSGVDVAGKKVVAFETVKEGDVQFAVHADINDEGQTVHFPGVKTKATDKVDGDHEAFAGEKQTIVDTVKVSNLTVGKTYKVKGTLHVQKVGSDGKITDGGVLKDGGKEVVAEKEFTADKANMTVTLEFTFNASALAGKTVVAFETLSRDGKQVGTHTDITDKEQSVSFPKIGTNLTDANGNHEVSVNGPVGKAGDKANTDKKAAESTAKAGDKTATGNKSTEPTAKAGEQSAKANPLPHRPMRMARMAKAAPCHDKAFFENLGKRLADKVGDMPKGTPLNMAKLLEMKDFLAAGAPELNAFSAAMELKGKLEKEGLTKQDIADAVVNAAVKQGLIKNCNPTPKPTEPAKPTPKPTEPTKPTPKPTEPTGPGITAKPSTPEVKPTEGKDGKTDKKGAKLTLIDRIGYENLIPGTEYTVSGTLHLKDIDKDGKVVDGGVLKDASGKEVTATTTFKPKTANGTVEVKFEFEAEGLAGKSVVAFEELMKGKQLVATHSDINDENQTVRIIEIGTTALDAENKTHTLTDSTGKTQKVSVIDTVSYTNLKVGQTYTVEGKLHMQKVDKDGKITDGGVVKGKDGKEVTATASFKPEKPDGTVEVKFEFEVAAGALDGTTLVAFEDLKNGDKVIATHADITDEAQSVHKLKVGTTLTGADKKGKDVQVGEKIDLIDTVAFENLVVGQEYVLKGKLVDASGKVLKGADGKEVTAESKFTPDKATGTAEMKFTVNTSAMKNGDKIVAYEYVYTTDGKLVGHHEDLKDTSQTVVVKKDSTTPKEHVDLKTGVDNFGRIAAVLMGILAAATAVTYAYRRRKGQA